VLFESRTDCGSWAANNGLPFVEFEARSHRGKRANRYCRSSWWFTTARDAAISGPATGLRARWRAHEFVINGNPNIKIVGGGANKKRESRGFDRLRSFSWDEVAELQVERGRPRLKWGEEVKVEDTLSTRVTAWDDRRWGSKL